jgi:hypothetical protein
LTRLDRASPITDTVLAFPAVMIRAGILDVEARPADAARAYESAEQLAPGLQVPVIGRAAALQRAGLTEEAVAEADRARRLPDGAYDPWPVFMRADARFIQAWLVELRKLLP